MKMKDILQEWRDFLSLEKSIIECQPSLTLLSEGGNAVAREYDSEGNIVSSLWRGEPAQARPIIFDEDITRTQFVNDVVKAIKAIHEMHKQQVGKGLYEDDALDFLLSGYTFMGSSEFLFSKDLSDDEYNRNKKKTGDIDLLVPKDKISTLYELLNNLKETKLTDNVTFVGHNKVTEAQIREEQINGILEYETPERRFLFQIDFVFVPFDEEGKPFEEEKFLRGSSWSDITLGIKGIGHKLLLQSLGSSIVTIPWGEALLATGTSRPDKIRLQVSLPDISSKRTPQQPRKWTQGESDDWKDRNSFGQWVSQYINDLSEPEIRKLYNTLNGAKPKVSWEEMQRFFDARDNNLYDLMKQILRGEGLAQSQNINFLSTFIVDSPTVLDFKLEDYFKSFSSMMSFSMGRGLSTKYKKEPYQVSGKDIYRYLKFDEREEKFRKAEDIFRAIFGQDPSVQDVRDAASFTGLIKIINRHLGDEEKIRAYDGLMRQFYELENFMSAHDIKDDLEPKEKIISYFEESVPAVKNSKKYQNKEEILSTWISRYEEKLSAP